MAFPDIAYKATSTELDPVWRGLVEDKFPSLDKYVGDETDVRCEIEFEKVTPSQSGPVHRVEVNFWLRGTLYRAEATEDSFEMAVDEVRNQLDKLLRRAHKKHNSLVRRGGRRLKDMMRWGK